MGDEDQVRTYGDRPVDVSLDCTLERSQPHLYKLPQATFGWNVRLENVQGGGGSLQL